MNLHNSNRNIFANNQLLHKNINYHQAIKKNPFDDPAIQNRINEQLKKLKQYQQQSEDKRFAELNKIFKRNNSVHLSIIKPIEVEKPNQGVLEFEHKKILQSKNDVVMECWNNRVATTYKGFLKKANVIEDDDQRKIKDKNELIIGHVNQYKNEKELEEKFYNKQNEIAVHNKQLKDVFSSSNEGENLRKFQYNHKYKMRIKYDPIADFDKLKQTQEEYFKSEKEKIEQEKKIVENLVNTIDFNDIKTKNCNLENLNSRNNTDTSTETINNTETINSDNSITISEQLLNKYKNRN